MSDTSQISPLSVWREFVDLEDFREDRLRNLPHLLEQGERADVMVVTGENAGGKSLVFTIVKQLARTIAREQAIDLEIMDIGMHRRTEGGIPRAMIFGDEATGSTGNISIKVIQQGVSSSRQRRGYHYLMLDEPDIGVGEGYHNAIGDYLAAFAKEDVGKRLGFVVATHSRRIAAKLVDAGASSLRVGGDLRPVREWIRDGDIEKSLDDLIGLQALALERWRAVSKMLG